MKYIIEDISNKYLIKEDNYKKQKLKKQLTIFKLSEYII